MAVRIGGDIAGLAALRALNSAADSASRARERLATGMRINRASDDAALLAVSEGLSAQSRILRQGTRNISDGLSLVTIADSALASIGDVITRMSELAEQAANGVYSSKQRSALNAEFQALSREIDRTSRTTEFNGINLLNGGSNSGSLKQLTSTTAGYGVTFNHPVLALTGDGRTAIVHNSNNQLQYIDTTTGAATLIANVTLSTVPVGVEPRVVTDATGDLVAFVSNDNLTGQNSGGFAQIYTYNRLSGQLTQITQSQGAEIFLGLAMSADGSKIAFDSFTNYGTTLSFGANQQINIYDTATGVITNTGYSGANGGAASFSLSADGTWLAFQSTLDDGNNADANNEWWTVDTRAATTSLRQVTSTTGADTAITSAYITNSGDLYFGSQKNITGGNAQLAGQIFKYSAAGGTIQQLTNASAGNNYTITGSNNDTKLYFISQYDPNGGAQTNNTGYAMDLSSNTFERLFTAPPIVSGQGAVISADGTRAIFVSQDNLLGTNADGNWELYTAITTKDQNNIVIDTGQGSTNSTIAMALQAANEAVRGLGGYLLTTQSAARGALRGLRENSAALSDLRGTLGAAGARLETSYRLGQSQANEVDAANSRIREADIAETVSALVASEIRQQLASFVLAQANLTQARVLSLLFDSK